MKDGEGWHRKVTHGLIGKTTMRQATGEKAMQTGSYAFDGYVDGTTSPAPTADERQIPMRVGETLPPVRSARKAAYWRI